jgi:phage tail sheath protein FI
MIATPPSGTAAGMIAQSEIQFGVPHGPANLIAERVVAVEEEISPARHDELHPLGINVYLQERDGVRLMAARTLSRDADLRQLSVRRLMMLLRRTIERQMQWMVFEPNGPLLRADVRQMLRTFLRRLFEAGAFRGASEEEAFFVRCDETNNPARLSDNGQLIVEIGVAPAEPIEFIVLRLIREGDALLVEETQ